MPTIIDDKRRLIVAISNGEIGDYTFEIVRRVVDDAGLELMPPMPMTTPASHDEVAALMDAGAAALRAQVTDQQTRIEGLLGDLAKARLDRTQDVAAVQRERDGLIVQALDERNAARVERDQARAALAALRASVAGALSGMQPLIDAVAQPQQS